MKRKITSVLIIVILLVIGYLFLVNANAVMNSVLFSFAIWKNNLVPALFPFFVLSEFLIQYGFVDFLGEFCKKFMNKVFRLPGECAFVFAMSMVSGFPSGAKYTKALYENKVIDATEASKLLTFTHFSNPLFIMGTLAITFLHNKKIGLLILFCHFFTNIILGIVFRSKKKINNNAKTSFRKALYKMHQKRIYNPLNFGQILTNSLTNTLQVLLLMLGIVSFFLIITTLIQSLIPFNAFEKAFISGILEMTQGVKYVSLLDLSTLSKSVLMTFLISFGGLSVHMQVLSIISDTKIKYRPFLIARILHAFIASFLVFILFPLVS